MPFTTLLLLAFGMGAASALAGASELRVSPRAVLFSDSFAAFAAFMLLLLVPASAYFYVFHGDWFMLYLLDVRRVPSALALLGFAVEVAVGLLGFGLSALCVRAARTSWSLATIIVCAIAAVGIVFVCPERLRVVGSFRQYRGGFGLVSYGGALMQGALAMGGLLLAGAAFLILRIRRG
ncbi:MAG: hypothetical protein RL701_2094 [Pseudomonadota bacterium]|jgi:hypothetical protein